MNGRTTTTMKKSNNNNNNNNNNKNTTKKSTTTSRSGKRKSCFYFCVVFTASILSAFSVFKFTSVVQDYLLVIPPITSTVTTTSLSTGRFKHHKNHRNRLQEEQDRPQQQQQQITTRGRERPTRKAGRIASMNRLEQIRSKNITQQQKQNQPTKVKETLQEKLARVESKLDTTFEKTFQVRAAAASAASGLTQNTNSNDTLFVTVTVGRQGDAVRTAVLHGLAQKNQGSHRSNWDRIETTICNTNSTLTHTSTAGEQNTLLGRYYQQLLVKTAAAAATTTQRQLIEEKENQNQPQLGDPAETTETTTTTTTSTLTQRSLDNPFEFLPQAILIGVQKGGTTALYTYLDSHPDIAHSNKELYFLDETMDQTRFIPSAHDGIDHFSSQLSYGRLMQRSIKDPIKDSNKMILDLTPNYLLYSDRLPQRIQCLVPNVKLFCLLRNPIDRARSQYDMKLKFVGKGAQNIYGKDVPTFDEYVQNDINALKETGVLQDWSIVDFEDFWNSPASREAWRTYINSGLNAPIGMSLYALQLRDYNEILGNGNDNDDNNNQYNFLQDGNQFLAIPSEELQYNTSATYQRVLQFLNLPSYDLNKFPQANKARRKESISDETREMLRQVFEPFNRKLKEMLLPSQLHMNNNINNNNNNIHHWDWWERIDWD